MTTDAAASPPARPGSAARRARLHAVVDHIDRHLAAPLDLHTLAAVAHVSPWHFHRVFQAEMGETVAECVRRRRLETAARRLLDAPAPTALAVALDVGFGSAEAFTRAFKAHFGQTPGAWRRGGWQGWAEARRDAMRSLHAHWRETGLRLDAVFDAETAVRTAGRTPTGAPLRVQLTMQPRVRVAYLRHVGPYGDPAIARLWQRFSDWCTAQDFPTPRQVYGVGHDSPDITAPERCRYDCCVEVDDGFRPTGAIGVQTIPGGRVLEAAFDGPPSAIHGAWMALYREALPASGWQADDRPAFEAYGPGPEFRIDPASGAFRCRLCLPVA